MPTPNRIEGMLHSCRPDRIVVQTRSGYCHVLFPEGFTGQERYHERVGKPCSVWAVRAGEVLRLKVADANTGMVAPRENGYVRRK